MSVDPGQLGAAAAEIILVVAAVLRNRGVLLKQHRETHRELLHIRRELKECRDQVQRWSGLP